MRFDERLDDAVGGAGLQRLRDGVAAPVGGDEDHRQVGERWKGFHQRDAVGAGQHEVQQDQAGEQGPPIIVSRLVRAVG